MRVRCRVLITNTGMVAILELFRERLGQVLAPRPCRPQLSPASATARVSRNGNNRAFQARGPAGRVFMKFRANLLSAALALCAGAASALFAGTAFAQDKTFELRLS